MASQLVGPITGTFKVGTGVKVGQPTFQPAKPKLTLKGQPFTTHIISGDLKVVTPGRAELVLSAETAIVTHSYSLPVGHGKLTLKAGAFQAKEPDKARMGQPYLNLKAKSFVLNRSTTAQLGKGKLILKGGSISKVGRTGLLPSEVIVGELDPTAESSGGYLVPTPAYTELLVPTSVRVV